MVKSKNELIYIIRQVIGHEESDGFYTYVNYNNDIIKVPNFLFKDAPAEYPEIRISPFLKDETISNIVQHRGYNYNNKQTINRAEFQIDIYATNIAQVNQIYDEVFNRIDLARDIEHIKYGYDTEFIEVEPNFYVNKHYTAKTHSFSKISIDNFKIDNVNNENDLYKYNNVYLLKDDGLYIHTFLEIKRIRIFSIINGLLLPDGNTIHSKNIVNLSIKDKIMISDLKKNNVERISFILSITYGIDNLRKSGPIATHANIKM